jgi:hypothetical protein
VTTELYEPLLERDLDAIPAAARAFADAHSIDELYVAVARFAVLSYAPSMHGKRAVMAVRAAHGFRDLDLIVECARYAARSRPPWSEPPIIEDAPDVSREELERHAGDDALLMIETAFALIPILGEKGRGALLRMPLLELALPQTRAPSLPLETLVDRAIASQGAIEDVTRVLVVSCGAAGSQPAGDLAENRRAKSPPLHKPPVYNLARDFAQTLLAHAHAPEYRRDEFLAAVQHNLEHGEDFSDFA